MTVFLSVGHCWMHHVFLANLLFSPEFSCAAYKTYSFTRVKQLGTIRFLEPLQSYSAARKEGIGLEMGLTLKDSQKTTLLWDDGALVQGSGGVDYDSNQANFCK